MKSIFHNELSQTHHETFGGSFDNLRDNWWLKERGCPLSQKELRMVEQNLKETNGVFQSNGTFGTKSVFQWDSETNKFLLFIHTPKRGTSSNMSGLKFTHY